ncbi:MAG: hypothetical protein JW942_09470 [Opitutales bacterium]|nr:hypothetical protein [Opitutales bacterium]
MTHQIPEPEDAKPFLHAWVFDPIGRFLRSLSLSESLGLIAGGVFGFVILACVLILLEGYRYETRFILKFYLCSTPLGVASILSLAAGIYSFRRRRRMK